jgi:hypothetical protein
VRPTEFPHLPLDVFNYGIKNLPHRVQYEPCPTSMHSLSVSEADKVHPQVIGYVEVICSNCFESESLKVMFDRTTDDKIFRTHHICSPHYADTTNMYPRHKYETLLMSKILGLSDQLAKMVKGWTEGGQIYLIAYKIDRYRERFEKI